VRLKFGVMQLQGGLFATAHVPNCQHFECLGCGTVVNEIPNATNTEWIDMRCSGLEILDDASLHWCCCGGGFIRKVALGAILATNHTREFSRIKGLTVVDWLDSKA